MAKASEGFSPQREGRSMVKIIIIVLVVLAVLFLARMLMARSR